MTKVVLLGVGNCLMGDDGTGGVAAGNLALADLPEGVLVIDAGTAATSYVGEIGAANHLIVLDAVERGGAPGSLYRFELSWDIVSEAPERPGVSHDLDLFQLIHEARSLQGLPEKVVVYGIEPSYVGPRVGLSRQVKATVPELVRAVMAEILELTGRPPSRRAERCGRPAVSRQLQGQS